MNSDVTVAYSMEECDEDTMAESQESGSLPFVFRKLHFWYIDPDGREVCSKDEAAVTINGRTITALIFTPCLVAFTHRCGVSWVSHQV